MTRSHPPADAARIEAVIPDLAPVRLTPAGQVDVRRRGTPAGLGALFGAIGLRPASEGAR